MGIITLVLLLGGFIPEFKVPFWVVLACATAITLGIMSGGWRIVRTVGFGIYKVRPLHAFDAQLTSASGDLRRLHDRCSGIHHARGQLIYHGHRRVGAAQKQCAGPRPRRS